MRTFIAIKVKPENALLQTITELKNELTGEPLRWVDEENLHLTLKFVGETTEEQAAQISNVLSGFALSQPLVSFILSGLGYFKNRKMPRVLFIGIQGGEALQQMAISIENILIPLGIEKDERPFNPHLTLARIKHLNNKRQFYQAVEAHQFYSSAPVIIKEIIFFQSHLTPSGPEYRELEKYSLKGAAL
jgi:RNA 2',3'-cyclic 3'-phosphodiesterase